MALAGGLVAVIVTSALFRIAVPDNIGMVVLGFVLGTAAMMALGCVVAARVSRASTGTAIGNIVLFSTAAHRRHFHRHRAGHLALPGRARQSARGGLAGDELRLVRRRHFPVGPDRHHDRLDGRAHATGGQAVQVAVNSVA